jgi:hypothetical protein
LPRRHDGHPLDGDNVSPPARRERQGNEPVDNIDDGATHRGTWNDSPPARRERQRNELNDDIDDGATHRGTWNDSPPARRERQRNELNDDIDDGPTGPSRDERPLAPDSA